MKINHPDFVSGWIYYRLYQLQYKEQEKAGMN
jgi:hypothetical protein